MTFNKFHCFILPLFFSVILLNACESDSNESSENNKNSNQKELKVSDIVKGEYLSYFNSQLESAEMVDAELSASDFMLTVNFSGNLKLLLKTDTLKEGTIEVIMSELKTDSDSYYYQTGTLNISSVNTADKTFSGTFTAIFKNATKAPVEITSSAFNSIPYVIKDKTIFTAMVNGNEWSAENVTAVINDQVNVLDIKGTTANDVDIKIYMPAQVFPDTYDLTGNGEYSAVVYPEGSDIGTHFSTSGEMTVVSHDWINYDIEINFHFKATRTGDSKEYDVSNGHIKLEEYH